jgi:hypothetical protein
MTACWEQAQSDAAPRGPGRGSGHVVCSLAAQADRGSAGPWSRNGRLALPFLITGGQPRYLPRTSTVLLRWSGCPVRVRFLAFASGADLSHGDGGPAPEAIQDRRAGLKAKRFGEVGEGSHWLDPRPDEPPRAEGAAPDTSRLPAPSPASDPGTTPGSSRGRTAEARPAAIVHPESLHPARTSGNSDVLELKGLTRRYGDVVALDDLSFTVAEGQLFGFVGPNGAGKTPPLEQRAPWSLRSDRVDQGRFGGEVQDLADPSVPAGS